MQVLQPPHAGLWRSVLKIDGTVCGVVLSAEGGDISAPVIRERDGGLFRKSLGPPVVEPIALSFDLSLNPIVYNWIAEFWSGNGTVRSGSLLSVDLNNQAKSELVFEGATIAATTVDALDAASKTPGRLTVQLTAERATRRQASGLVVDPVGRKKKWLSCNFGLHIEGLETTRVARIEPLTAVEDQGATDIGDLRLFISADAGEAWAKWHESCVVHGNRDEKVGELAFLAPDLQTVLGRVALRGLGIRRLALEPVPDRATQISRLVAELYCQRMELEVLEAREPSAEAAAETPSPA